MVQELQNEQMKTRQTLSLWQEYSPLFDQCSLNVQQLWHQWDNLGRQEQQDKQAVVHSVEVSSGSLNTKSTIL